MNKQELFWYFVQERLEIYRKRNEGLPKPWTSDPILQQYKFTNVYRELDRTSKWVADNWRTPHRDDPYCWFAMAVAVMTNKIETMDVLGYPVPFKLDRFLNVTREHGFGTAYMLTTHRKPIPKPDYYGRILDTLWQNRERFAPELYPNLAVWHMRLCHLDGVASFIAAQIIAASKYISPFYEAFPDWSSFVASGPGSRRGLARFCDLPIDYNWDESVFRATINELRKKAELDYGIKIHAQDLQNCFCEYDKYSRVYFKESGRPKCRFDGGA